jgi:hypothetical protein
MEPFFETRDYVGGFEDKLLKKSGGSLYNGPKWTCFLYQSETKILVRPYYQYVVYIYIGAKKETQW